MKTENKILWGLAGFTGYLLYKNFFSSEETITGGDLLEGGVVYDDTPNNYGANNSYEDYSETVGIFEDISQAQTFSLSGDNNTAFVFDSTGNIIGAYDSVRRQSLTPNAADFLFNNIKNPVVKVSRSVAEKKSFFTPASQADYNYKPKKSSGGSKGDSNIKSSSDFKPSNIRKKVVKDYEKKTKQSTTLGSSTISAAKKLGVW